MITIDGGTGKVLYNGVDIASRIMIDQWRRNAALNLSSGENYLTSDWERVDTAPQGACIPGGGMTESSGVFTFPMTGIYKVEWQCSFEDTGSASVNNTNIYELQIIVITPFYPLLLTLFQMYLHIVIVLHILKL